MSDGLDFDDFLGHSQNAGGGGFLNNWKDDGSIVVWLHPEARIHPLWTHRWFRYAKDKDGGGGAFKSHRFNCLESENVLKRQRFRHKDGTREYPPTTCPHCLLLEHVRQMIADGEISWTDPLFKLVDDESEIIIHAGGFTGQFGKRDMSDSEKRSLRRAGIRMDEAFKENGSCSLEYIFRVISDAKPEEGCTIAMEKPALGAKVQKALKDRADEYAEEDIEITNWRGETFKGKAAANPKNNPCAIKLSYDANKDFSDKYDAKIFDKKKPSPGVIAAFETEPPDVDRLLAVPSLAAHRASLEKACLVDIPWDDIFAPAEKALDQSSLGGEPDEEELDQEEDGEEEDDFPESWGGKGNPVKSAKEKAAKPPAQNPEKGTKSTGKASPPDEEMVECDACGKPMHETDMTCPHCKAEYEEVDGEIVLKKVKPAAKRRRPAKS